MAKQADAHRAPNESDLQIVERAIADHEVFQRNLFTLKRILTELGPLDIPNARANVEAEQARLDEVRKQTDAAQQQLSDLEKQIADKRRELAETEATIKDKMREYAAELAEADTPQARQQAVLDRHSESVRAQAEPDDEYFVGGFQEFHSKTPSFHKSKRDRDWRVR